MCHYQQITQFESEARLVQNNPPELAQTSRVHPVVTLCEGQDTFTLQTEQLLPHCFPKASFQREERESQVYGLYITKKKKHCLPVEHRNLARQHFSKQEKKNILSELIIWNEKT